MHRIPLAAMSLAGAAVLVACGSRRRPDPPKTVGHVDLQRYAGLWFEQARFPNVFQDRPNLRCVAVTASYALRPDGTVGVLNHARDAANGGRVVSARGYARVVTPRNDKLRVTFFWPIFGDYWILGLGEDYQWSVVGTPDRRFLWILSRNAVFDAEEYSAALAIARREGFDLSRLNTTPTTYWSEDAPAETG